MAGSSGVFGVEDRERLRAGVLELAARDERVVAGALVGGLANGGGDRFSDLDLTFGVADDASVADVLADWTRELEVRFDAVRLFDLPAGAAIYRVFLLPGCLQFDLSFAPASQWGAGGPKFELLFGEAAERALPEPPPASELLGLGVHHALRAHFSIERGRVWQAEYWISGVRDEALALACRRHGLPVRHGRGVDGLPAEVRDPLRDALVRSLERDELRRALRVAVAGLRREAVEAPELAASVEPALRELTGFESGTAGA